MAQSASLLMKPSAQHLLLTAQGSAWLSFFDEADKPLLRELTAALSLVSVSEFERSLVKLVRDVAEKFDTVALYTAREFKTCLSFEEAPGDCESGLDATPRGGDIGSEGRTAHIARQLHRSDTSKYVLQPSLAQMRQKQVDCIMVIDDLLGTGDRCSKYLTELWKYATVKSWWSYKLIKFAVVAYAGTEDAISLVSRHRAGPEVHVHRYCPRISTLPWPSTRRALARTLCTKYAKRWRLALPLGYKATASLLVFEHGCPNNVPSIFWARASKGPEGWRPIFEGRSTSAGTASAFPYEFEADTPVSALVSAGEQRLAQALASVVHRPLPANVLVVLALVWKGKRRLETLADATGLDSKGCGELLEACIASGFMTPLRRITSSGLAELRGVARSRRSMQNPVPDLGEDEYYPVALRGRGNG